MKHVEFYRNDKDGSVLVSVGTQVPEKLISSPTLSMQLKKNTYRLSRKSMVIWKSTSAQ